MTTLYPNLLGQQFTDLHPVLRRFHASSQGTATGRMRVAHPAHWLGRLLVWCLGLPPAGESVAVRLVVTPWRGGERWRRSFDGVPFFTDQTAHGTLLLERHGPLTFGLAVRVRGGGLVFLTRRVWLWGLPLPGWFAPSARARVWPRPDGWVVAVRLTMPGLGPILRYQGRMVA